MKTIFKLNNKEIKISLGTSNIEAIAKRLDALPDGELVTFRIILDWIGISGANALARKRIYTKLPDNHYFYRNTYVFGSKKTIKKLIKEIEKCNSN